MMKRRFVLLLFVTVIAAQGFSQVGQTADPWVQWKFLLGAWEGKGSGAPGAGVGGSLFALDLDAKILIRHNRADVPAKPGEKVGTSHTDLLIVYPSPGEAPFRAIYFDNEGHVINYVVSFPQKQSAVRFESEGSAGAPRFRLDYVLTPAGELAVTFSIAPPGGAFNAYTQGVLDRRP